MLDATPTDEKVKKVVSDLDPDSAPGPDGFVGWFYRTTWEVIGKDFTKATKFCWNRGFIPNGLNSNFLLLLPKVKNAKRANQFRPIGLMNFSFKVIIKIITSRLGGIIQKIVSPQQAAFIKGRNIQDQIVLASELVNELDTTRRGGNIGSKLDITQAYDSLSWEFLLHKLNLPSHIFSVDDTFLFCNGDKRNVKKLLKILKDYKEASGQIISLEKSKCFIGGTSESRKLLIAEECNMVLYAFPDKYLGVNLIPVRIKTIHLWGFAEMMQERLDGWKGKLLSFQERLILVKFVLCSIPIYNMAIYKWPQKVLKECEIIIRNFLWTGDPATRKLITVKWDYVCSPIDEGGLGLRRLEIINKAMLMARFFKAKYQNQKGEWIEYYKKSSIWTGLKWIADEVYKHTRWLVVNGINILVGKDIWIKDKALN
ncbi:uncharacterized protein LOC113333618 [Papaver somniferum]|uniref:uncharacterized protein LOC113333618 n=1 Tax=Papaver somniferum TaxID=3469 RepID=UPI000E7014B7|nr:uncharacterized protein LOC113333618 [Papaver somniferum]